MKLTVKTLKGEKFPIDIDASSTVAQAKGVIVSDQSTRECLLCIYYTSIPNTV